MSILYNTNILSTNLQLLLDVSNNKSYNGQRSLINWNSWTTGSGGTSGYSQNGDTAENERVVGTDPWGYSNVVWETRASGNGEADGGWNTNWFNIDNTKLYRFSVWVKRTSSTAGGTFYLGMHANGDGSRRMDNGTVEGNAYWECTGTGALTQNQWYLWVGHVYPHTTTLTTRHPDTGYYTISGGRIGNVGGCNIGSGDLKWSTNSTQGLHRTYHYYCGDNTTRLQFYQPRVDLVDGTEPSISDLLNNVASRWSDVSGNNRHFTWSKIPSYTANSTKTYLSTFGNRSSGPASNSFGINNGTGYTIFMVSTTQTDNSNSAFKFYGSESINRGIFLHPGWSNYTMYFDQAGCCEANQRTQYTFTLADMRNFRIWTFRSRLYDRTIFMNGIPYVNNTTYAGNINLNSSVTHIGGSDESGGELSNWDGQLAYFAVYNTGLDNDTVMNMSNALRVRFSV